MSDMDLDQLRSELSDFAEPEKKVGRSAHDERIITGFEEIQRFVETQGRSPQHGEDRDIFERLYAVRLDRLRALEECRSLLAPLDRQGLLHIETPGVVLMRYVLDTNIWVQLAQGKISCADLSKYSDRPIVVAPFVMMELMKESVKHAGKYFENDKRVFECMAQFDVLPLTQPFVYQRLWSSAETQPVRVVPETYKRLLQMVVSSASYTEFIKNTEASGSEWSGVERWDTVHQAELDKELGFVRKFAEESHESIAIGIAKLYPLKGSLAKEDLIEKEFSAALEYLRSLINKVKNGADLIKNDRGAYVDFQFLFYLADNELTIVSNEDFSTEILNSPQKS